MKKLTILSSGLGLGVYIPSLLLKKQFEKRGIECQIVVIEDFYLEQKLKALQKNKKNFHKNYKVAVMGHKLINGQLGDSLDAKKIKKLLRTWSEEERTEFIIMSGQWVEIMLDYVNALSHETVNVECIRMDTMTAPTWRAVDKKKIPFKNIWLFDTKANNIAALISGNTHTSTPFTERDHRIMIHGGGWGMGTYQDKIEALTQATYHLNIVYYDEKEIQVYREKDRYYLLDEHWKAWGGDGKDDNSFPRMYEIDSQGKKNYLDSESGHSMLEVYSDCVCIISKPGGGTLLDSLITATPLVLLEPIAEHEKLNAKFWIDLGFGIDYNVWKEMDFSKEVLLQMHRRLLKAKSVIPEYVDGYFNNEKVI